MTLTDQVLTKLGIKPEDADPELREKVSYLLRRGLSVTYAVHWMEEYLDVRKT